MKPGTYHLFVAYHKHLFALNHASIGDFKHALAKGTNELEYRRRRQRGKPGPRARVLIFKLMEVLP